MNTQTGKSHDGRYASCGMGGKRGLALTAKYVWIPRLTCGICKIKEIQIFPRNSWAEKKKEKKPEKAIGNLPNFLWAHSPSTWQAHRETQLASWWLSNSLSLGMLWRDNGFPNLWPWDDQTVSELELLLCPKMSSFKDFLLTQKTNCQTFLLNGLPFTIYSYCSEKSSFWHFLNSECLTLKPAESIVCFGNLQFCSLAELLNVVTLRINVYLKQSKKR